MGLLLKIFIPLLGAALAFYFYSAPENFNEGKSWQKEALQAQQGCCQKGTRTWNGLAESEREGWEGREALGKGSEHKENSWNYTGSAGTPCLTSVNHLFGK